jgi:hypothetical protein
MTERSWDMKIRTMALAMGGAFLLALGGVGAVACSSDDGTGTPIAKAIVRIFMSQDLSVIALEKKVSALPPEKRLAYRPRKTPRVNDAARHGTALQHARKPPCATFWRRNRGGRVIPTRKGAHDGDEPAAFGTSCP